MKNTFIREIGWKTFKSTGIHCSMAILLRQRLTTEDITVETIKTWCTLNIERNIIRRRANRNTRFCHWSVKKYSFNDSIRPTEMCFERIKEKTPLPGPGKVPYNYV